MTVYAYRLWVSLERRHSVAYPAMGGRGGRPPPTDQKLGLVMAARLRHGGKFSLKSLTFGHFLHKNVQKTFSFRRGFAPLNPHQGLCPWTPLGAPPRDSRLGSRSARSPWSAPLWQILDPPLSEFQSAGPATLKPWEANVVQTRETDNQGSDGTGTHRNAVPVLFLKTGTAFRFFFTT